MRIVYYTHSLRSCWNHGNAHFLRGVASELVARGHEIRVYEPEGAWSLANLLGDHGEGGLDPWRTAYPELSSETFAADADHAALGAHDEVQVAQAHVEVHHDHVLARLRQRRAQGGGGGGLADATLAGRHDQDFGHPVTPSHQPSIKRRDADFPAHQPGQHGAAHQRRVHLVGTLVHSVNGQQFRFQPAAEDAWV